MKLSKFSLAIFVTINGQYNPTIDVPTTEATTMPMTGLSCFHCDAMNMTHCEDIGATKPCPENAQSCMIEIRKREGQIEQVLIILNFKATAI